MRLLYRNEVFYDILTKGITMQIIRQTLNFPDESIQKGNLVTLKRYIRGKTLTIVYQEFPEFEETLHKMVLIKSISFEWKIFLIFFSKY